MIVLQRQFALPQLRPRLLFRTLFSLPLDPMHVAHRGRAPVASRAGMEILEGIEIPAPDTAAFCQQGGEVVRPGAEGRGLFKQCRVTG